MCGGPFLQPCQVRVLTTFAPLLWVATIRTVSGPVRGRPDSTIFWMSCPFCTSRRFPLTNASTLVTRVPGTRCSLKSTVVRRWQPVPPNGHTPLVTRRA